MTEIVAAVDLVLESYKKYLIEVSKVKPENIQVYMDGDGNKVFFDYIARSCKEYAVQYIALAANIAETNDTGNISEEIEELINKIK